MFNTLITTINNLDTTTVSNDRKNVLQPLVNAIKDLIANNKTVNINFICTHNSRRSHLGQVWAQTMANYYNVAQVNTFSGGTEATALFPKVAETLTNQGFNILKLSETENPIYGIKNDANSTPIIGFSKTFDNEFNPKNEFIAVLTCSQADEGCPFIAGAKHRIPITYNDPKAFDNTPEQSEKYLERSIEVATEMKWVFSEIQK